MVTPLCLSIRKHPAFCLIVENQGAARARIRTTCFGAVSSSLLRKYRRPELQALSHFWRLISSPSTRSWSCRRLVILELHADLVSGSTRDRSCRRLVIFGASGLGVLNQRNDLIQPGSSSIMKSLISLMATSSNTKSSQLVRSYVDGS